MIADGRPAKPRRAMFSVDGTRFTAGELRTTIGDAGVEAWLSPDGGVEKVSVYIVDSAGGAGHDVSATLVRIKR